MKSILFGGLLTLACTAALAMAHSKATTRPADGEAAVCTACQTAATTRPTTQPTAKAVNELCPVEPDEKIDPEFTIVYEGKTIGFCCKDCIKDFKKDPAKYLARMK